MTDSLEHRREIIWNTIERKIANYFGRDRVTKDRSGIKILFDFNKPEQFEQSEGFAALALKQRLIFTPKMLSENTAESLIPFNEDSLRLALVIDDLSLSTKNKIGRESHRLITPNDPRHILTDLTGVPWREVVGSRYGTDVIEAVLPKPVDSPTRAKQENGVSVVVSPLNPDLAAHHDVKGWLEHQQTVEQGDAPRTLIPAEWTNEYGIESARQRQEYGQYLRPVFVGKER